jgi:hypothetical protein
MARLGDLYRRGQGVPHDLAVAFGWFKKAAEAGEASAQAQISAMYFHGRGVPRSELDALQWAKKAAEQGNPFGQRRLALHYLKGVGVPQMEEEAARLYEQAANQGDGHAQARLGGLYLVGKGVQRDPRKAYNWLLLAGARLEGPEQLRAQMGALKVKVLLTPEQRQGAELWAKEWQPKLDGKHLPIATAPAVHGDPDLDE